MKFFFITLNLNVFCSIKKILHARDQHDDEMSKFDETKLIDFVCPIIAPSNLQNFFDGTVSILLSIIYYACI